MLVVDMIPTVTNEASRNDHAIGWRDIERRGTSSRRNTASDMPNANGAAQAPQRTPQKPRYAAVQSPGAANGAYMKALTTNMTPAPTTHATRIARRNDRPLCLMGEVSS